MTSIGIPGAVTEIGQKAFYCCDGLTDVNISDSVEEMGGGAFGKCAGLKTIMVCDATLFNARFPKG